jgi:hypothetical protein
MGSNDRAKPTKLKFRIMSDNAAAPVALRASGGRVRVERLARNSGRFPCGL